MIIIQSKTKQVDATAWGSLLRPLLFILALLTLGLYHGKFINYLSPFSFFRWSVLLHVIAVCKFSISDSTASATRFKIFLHTLCKNNVSQNLHLSVGAVGCGIPLQTVESRVPFPMVLLEFFIDIIVQAALRPWSRFSLIEIEVKAADR